jgi:hypothetical protein
MQMFDLAHDSKYFVDPRIDVDFSMHSLYEGKMIHLFDHRWSAIKDGSFQELGVEEKCAPESVRGRYMIQAGEVDRRLLNRWNKKWLYGIRSIARATDGLLFPQ